MRVLFASTRLSGGAGIACRRIWEALREQNRVHKATLVYRENADLWLREHDKNTGNTFVKKVYRHASEWADERLSKHFNEERSDFSATYLSALELKGPYDEALISLFDEHDIVNMHWVSGMFSVKCLQYLREKKKPVLITMHDQKHFTGACHYAAGCRLFTKICSSCPQLATKRAQLLAEQQHRIKHSILSSPNFYWTGPSEWILKEAASSGIPHSTVHVLPSLKNPVIDDAICTPDETNTIAAKFSAHKRRVAIVADDLNDPRKGSLIGVRALAMAVAGHNDLNEGIELHLAGATEGTETIIRDLANQCSHIGALQPLISVVNHGRVPSHHLAVILKLVDLLIFPSIEENYSNLVIETLVQGTAIAAFAVGGNREIAEAYPKLMRVAGNRLNISNGFNSHDKARLCHATKILSRTIESQLSDTVSPADSRTESRRCREVHSRDHIAESYLITMQSVLDCNLKSNADSPAAAHPSKANHSQQPRPNCNENRRRVVNKDEPVFWLGTNNDWPMHVAYDKLLLMLALQPSWDENYISSRLNYEDWSWNQFTAFKNDSYQVPELQYWDMVAVIGTKGWQSAESSNQLLLPTSEPENSLPILLQAVVALPTKLDITWNTITDLLWQTIFGECIVAPMKGMSHFPCTTNFVQTIELKTTTKKNHVQRPRIPLSTISQMSINVKEPIFWLGRHTFNDLTMTPEQIIVSCGLYPSWEPDYLLKIFSAHAKFEVMHEVRHTEWDLPELRYWNTIVFRVSASVSCHLFTENTDEVHGFPVLYMGHGRRSAVPSVVSVNELVNIAEELDTVIPPMAGLHKITSSLR